VAGLAAALGSGAMSNDIPGIVDNDALLVIGSNTSATHPIIALRMREAVKRGATMIVADPRRITLAQEAEIHLQHNPGSDAALIGALCHVIIRDGLQDDDFIACHTENFADFADGLKELTPEKAQELTGVDAALIEDAARKFAKAENGAIYYTMGITQHASGTNNVLALANLALLTGNLGKPGAGLNPLRGQNNVQGSSDMGCLPNLLPGYQRVDDPEARERFEKAWDCELPKSPGLTATEMTHAMVDGKINALWIMGENPILSDPNSTHIREALESLDFLVVQDIFLTETAELADVVLPAASFAEKNGTFTNTERRVQRVRKAVDPPGEAREDLKIIDTISQRMAHGHGQFRQMDYRSRAQNGGCLLKANNHAPAVVFDEIASLWPALAGIDYDRLEKGGIQWPCPDKDHPGTPYLFAEGFPNGKASFNRVVPNRPAERPDAEYPLVLTTGRVLYQYHTGTMTRKSAEIEAADIGPHVQINPADAQKLDISDGDLVKASSRRGSIKLKAVLSDAINSGVVFMPFHYKEAAANLLTNDVLDPVCKIPEAKVCAVRLQKVE